MKNKLSTTQSKINYAWELRELGVHYKNTDELNKAATKLLNAANSPEERNRLFAIMTHGYDPALKHNDNG